MKPKEEPREPLAPTPETDAAFDLRHTKTCTIAHFRQVMEKMERERDKAQYKLEDARQSLEVALGDLSEAKRERDELLDRNAKLRDIADRALMLNQSQ